MTQTQTREIQWFPIPEYQYVDTATVLHAAVHRLRQQPVRAARTIDTETTGREPFTHRLKVVQIGVEMLPIYVIQIERIDPSKWGPLRQYLAEPRLNVLQNAKFDLKMLAAENLPLAGTVRDTILRSKLYHLGNRQKRHGLGDLVYYWCHLKLDKTEQISFVADESRSALTVTQRDYAAKDIAATKRVDAELALALQNQRHKRPGIWAHIDREERFLPLLAQLENQGVVVDVSAVEGLAAEIRTTMQSLEDQLQPILQPNLKQLKLKLGRKPTFVPSKFAEAALKSAFQLENADTKTLLKESLRQPHAKLVLEHTVLWRQLNACTELLQKRNPKTGKWHADHSQVENLQGTLQPSKLKVELLERLTQSWRPERVRLLQAEDGCVFLEVSFPNLERRLLAHYSQDPQLLEDLADGESPVVRLATAIAHSGVETEYSRELLAKTLWHGVGVLNQKGLRLQVWLLNAHGVILDPHQVRVLQTLIPERYPQLQQFQTTINDLRCEQRTTVLGALRVWEQSSLKDLRSFIINGSFSELLKACVCCLQTWGTDTRSRVAFVGERTLLLEVPEAQADSLTEAVLTTLAEALGQLCPQLVIEIEASRLLK